MKLHLCSIYETRPEWCCQYPWNNGNDIFEGCQFNVGGTLISEDELRKTKTQEEINRYCVECGKCCHYWENGKKILACSALIIIEESELLARIRK